MRLMNKIMSFITILKANILKKNYPLLVTLRPTYKCNFRCKYCKVWAQKESELTTQQYFKIIDDLKKLGTQKLGFAGGEPLLRQDIGKLIDYAHKKGIMTSLSTNGSLVKAKINEIKNLDLLTLSLDGKEKIHDKYTQKGSYKKAIEAIRIARENGIKVWTITVLHKNNLDQVDFMLDLAEKMHFEVIFQPVYFHELTGDIHEMYPSKEEFKEVVEKLIKYKKQGRPVASSFMYLRHMLQWPRFDKKFFCWAGRLFWTLTPNGNLYQCGGAIGFVKPINITKVGFKKAMDMSEDYAAKCPGCWFNCYVENSFLFSLKPAAVLNVAAKLK